uniref:VWFA domain-containing protein n=1 Tax=Alexandrium catenella TaxID=2925 RepID=A0A7S1M5B3_ALECA
MQHEELKQAMLTMRNSCSSKFRGLESELCALKKIRGELNKMKGDKHPFFQDCEVAPKWEEKECSVTCGGGTQELTRAIITPPSGGGAACPPTKQMQTCNEQPCPVDCKLSQWSGFSACSAACGGGVSERTRLIKQQPRYEGDPCGGTEETVPCNMDACDTDCGLAPWTKWSDCSKACDSGTRTRRRAVSAAAVGRGECPHADSPARLERKTCNTQACIRDKSKPLVCTSKVDVVLLLDGSGSIGTTGWAATKKFAKTFVDAFDGQNAGATTDAQISVILFSGPYKWSLMKKCVGMGASSSSVNMETDCMIKVAQHFKSDLAATKTAIDQLTWPKGTTLTSAALETARSELALGRADAEKIVLTITDGIPLSSRSTMTAAHRLKKSARLMFGAVKMSSRGLGYMMKWGSSPVKENVIQIKSFQALESLETVDALVADMCRNVAVPTGSSGSR